ncbi:MAG: hypothetical protein O2894_12825, partial [Planctomycetota bacterium]|nr:hypothetical protein [Planctomycetota bacterium]
MALLLGLSLSLPGPARGEEADEIAGRAALAGLAAPDSQRRLAGLDALEPLARADPRWVERALPRLKAILNLRE